MANKIRFFRYSGSKQYLLPDVQNLIKDKKYSTYYELFLGSGAIFLNLEDSFDEYVINDISKEIISLYNFVKNYEYSDLINIKKEIQDKFGDIKNNKESYYAYRQYYNSNYYNTIKEDQGGYYYFLVNSCINSFARFGPNGFNSSYGNRLFFLEESQFKAIKERLKKTIIHNCDYSKIEIKENSLIFLDPPYFKRPSSYSSSFNESSYLEFKNYVYLIKEDFIYTDIESEDFNNFKKIEIRNIKNSSPHKRKSSENTLEVMHTNII